MPLSSPSSKTKKAPTPILPVHRHPRDGTPNTVDPSQIKRSRRSLKIGRNARHKKLHAKQESNDHSSSTEEVENDSYEDFPLIQSMMASEAKRTAALTKEGAKQIKYIKSNAGWIRSLFVLRGRALDRILLPWTIVTLNAVAWAVAYDKLGFRDPHEGSNAVSSTALRRDYIEGVLELVLTTTMAFLLVFRLNRSATRFWIARGSWGIIVVKCRAMVGSILLHGSHDPHHRDQAIRWIASFAIASMNHSRGQSIDPDVVAGVLSHDELDELNAAEHSPLHAADRIRFHLAQLLGPIEEVATEGTPNGEGRDGSHSHDDSRSIVLSDFRGKQLLSLEEQLNVMIDEEGALERIKGTPLPLVYVTHLRTWLMLFLLTLPYFWEASLGYALIPVECLAAFALLGLEGAASEVEAPFRKDRTNHLDMDSYCMTVLSNILQQAKEDARRRTNTKPPNKTA